MTWEASTFVLTVMVLALQAWNLYVSASIKLWAEQRFVSKQDFLETLNLWGGKK